MEQEVMWCNREGFTITTDKSHLNIELIHQFLSEKSYWSKGIHKELVVKAIDNSVICYGIYKGNPFEDEDAHQVGFARVVSDLVRFSWLGDVFVLEDYRGKGLSKWLMSIIVENPYLKGTAFNLGTLDAHTLYQKFGFQPLERPENRLSKPLNWDLINQAHELSKES